MSSNKGQKLNLTVKTKFKKRSAGEWYKLNTSINYKLISANFLIMEILSIYSNNFLKKYFDCASYKKLVKYNNKSPVIKKLALTSWYISPLPGK